MTLRFCRLKTYLTEQRFTVDTSEDSANTWTIAFPAERGVPGSFLLALHELPDSPDLLSCTTARPLLQFLYLFDLSVNAAQLSEVQRLISLINKTAPLPGLGIDLQCGELFWRYGLVCYEQLSESDILVTLEHLGQQIAAYETMLRPVLEGQLEVDTLIAQARTAIEG